MPARANRRAPSYVWAAALAALAPNAFAQSPDQTPAPSTDTASPPEPRPVGYSWETDAIDCADAVGPWSSAVAVGAPLFAGLAYVDASPHALVLRHAPMAPFDPWVPVDDTPAAPAAPQIGRASCRERV